VVLEAGGVLAGVETDGVEAEGVETAAGAEEEVLFEELPQPASASRPTAMPTIATVWVERVFALPAAWKLTSQILRPSLGLSNIRTPSTVDPSRSR
jgi:hypothetical protein